MQLPSPVHCKKSHAFCSVSTGIVKRGADRAPLLLFFFLTPFNGNDFAMTILLYTGMRATIQWSMTKRADRATSRDNTGNRARKFMRFLLGKKERNTLLLAHNKVRLQAAPADNF